MTQEHDPPAPPARHGPPPGSPEHAGPSELPPRVPLDSSQAPPAQRPPPQPAPVLTPQSHQYPPHPQGAYPAARVPETNGLAIASLVCGVLGLSFIPFLASIAAVILAPKAKAQIDASEGREVGRGMAVAGQITGWIGIALGLLGIVVVGFLIVGLAAASGSG